MDGDKAMKPKIKAGVVQFDEFKVVLNQNCGPTDPRKRKRWEKIMAAELQKAIARRN